MKTFFDRIHLLVPHLTRHQLVARLNAFEVELFRKLPWALDLPESMQNELIEYAFSLSESRHGATH